MTKHSRRGFLALLGSAAVAPLVPAPTPAKSLGVGGRTADEILADSGLTLVRQGQNNLPSHTGHEYYWSYWKSVNGVLVKGYHIPGVARG